MHPMNELLSLKKAAKLGITKLRLDNWAIPEDHIEIYIADDEGHLGPWVKLYSPFNERIGKENPLKLLVSLMGDPDDACWRAYVESN